MAKYIVSILRKGYGFNNVQIDAPDEKTAKEKALDEAGHHAYTEHSSEYEVLDWIVDDEEDE
jgi:hypothetical protein|tara:strand:+ start:4229 stop:4414 length:186 start_codon:yes stop_codon:yes gene_type:complete